MTDLAPPNSPQSHDAAWVRKAFREGWQTGRYDGGSRRRALIVGLLWAINEALYRAGIGGVADAE